MSNALLRQIDWHATHRPGGAAIIEADDDGPGRALAWSEVRQAIARFAAILRSSVEERGTVLLCGPNVAATLLAFHACLAADRTVFPVAATATSRELHDAAIGGGAVAVIGAPPALAALAPLNLISFPLSAALDDGDRKRPSQAAHSLDNCRGEGAMILQSSGSTGLPKLVRREMSGLEAVARNCRKAIAISPEDRMLAVAPVTHSYGIDHAALAWAISGCAVQLCARFDPSHLRRMLRRDGVTLFPATPFMLDALSHSDAAPVREHRLRQVYSAGSALPRRVFEAFERSFGIAAGQVYGSTEFGSVTFNDPALEPFDPLAVGRPMEGVRLRIEDAATGETAGCRAGEGGLSVAAPSMMAGYIRQPRMLSADGFLATGDLGRIDAHGRLTITGRTKLLIEVGGLKVNPMEVEAVLLSHPSVAQAAVVAMPMSDTIQRVKAIIVWGEGGGDVEELRQYLRTSLSPHKLPRVIEARDSLPRTATGKLLRGELA